MNWYNKIVGSLNLDESHGYILLDRANRCGYGLVFSAKSKRIGHNRITTKEA
jgi:hypothetical protein